MEGVSSGLLVALLLVVMLAGIAQKRYESSKPAWIFSFFSCPREESEVITRLERSSRSCEYS